MMVWMWGLAVGALAEDAPDEVIVVSAEGGGAPQVDAGDVDRRGDRSVADALAWEVGITGATGPRGERILSLRGFDQRQLAVSVDGVPAAVPFDGQLDLSRLAAGQVASIEVMSGAGAGLLGAGGLGGAVQIRSRPPPEQAESAVLARCAAHGAAELSGWGGGPVGAAKVAVGVDLRGSPGSPLPRGFVPGPREDGGLRDASSLRHQGLSLAADLGPVEGRLSVAQGEVEVPTGLTDARPRYWRFTSLERVAASVTHRAGRRGATEVVDTVYLSADTSVLDSFDDASRQTQRGPDGWRSVFRDQRVGGALRVRRSLGGGASAGAWSLVDHQRHREDEGGDRLVTTLWSGGALAEAAVWGGARAFLGVEVDAELPAGSLSPLPPVLGPSLALSRRWGPGGVSLGIARRARHPALKERYSDGLGLRLPNLSLGPERAWHLGADADWRIGDAAVLRASVYGSEVADLIEAVPLGEGVEQLQNLGRAELIGGELSALYLPTPGLELRGSAGALRTWQRSGVWASYPLSLRPAWQAVAEVSAAPWRQLTLWGAVRALGPQRYLDRDTLVWGTLGSSAVFEASAAVRQRGGWTWRLRASNLLDSQSVTLPGYPEPGREIWLELAR
ncbi:MAG: TonB-dependent receptor [Deltaproteobacteria bacterium]|nr:TonB-dependent receptor [Deltaproteobacteria bacterium]